MTKERRQLVERIYQDAVDLPSDARDRFLSERCGEDDALRSEVESLLAHYEQAADRFLQDSPVHTPDFHALPEMPERVGRYHVLRKIGEGGMGVVFEAEQTSPKRRVAVKLIRPGFHSRRLLRRFQLESEVLGRLQHPGIAHVYEAGVAEVTGGGSSLQSPFFAMEYIEGEPLNRFVKSRGLPVREILELVARVCEAVEYAHRKGVIHRDLKPGNILVDAAGRPKVLDFGVARTVDPELETTFRTGLGEVVGTIPYMSPQQLGGDSGDVDTRADVYALGVILYELLAGVLPLDVQGLGLLDAVRKVSHETPRNVSAWNKEAGEEIDTIVGKALEKTVDRRYPSAQGLADDIRRYLAGEPIEAKRDSGWYVIRKQISRHRLAIGAAAAFVVLLSVSSIVAWTLFLSAKRARSVAEDRTRMATERLWTSYLERARAGRAGGEIGRRFRSLESLRLASEIRPSMELRNEAIACMTLSDLKLVRRIEAPDSQALLNVQGLKRIDRFAVVNRDTITIRSLPDREVIARFPGPPELNAARHAFSPDGRYYGGFFVSRDARRFIVWDALSGETLMDLGEAWRPWAHGLAFSTPSIGPSWVALTTEDGVHSFLLPSGEHFRHFDDVEDPVWNVAVNGAGDRVAAALREKDVLVLEPATGRLIRRIETPVLAYSLDWSWDGSLLAAGCVDSRLRVWDLTGDDEPRVLSGHQGVVIQVQLLPDMRHVASASWDNSLRFWDLIEGREVFQPFKHRLLRGGGGNVLAAGGPDSGIELWTYEPSREFRTFAGGSAFGAVGDIAFLPDDRYVVTCGRDGARVWDAAGGRLVQTLHEGNCISAFISPDGRRILVTMLDGIHAWPVEATHGIVRIGEEEIVWDEPMPGGGSIAEGRLALNVGYPMKLHRDLVFFDLDSRSVSRRLPGYNGMLYPQVSPDGKWAFTGTWKADSARVWNLETGEHVLKLPGPHVTGTFSPDGRLLVLTRGERYRFLEVGTWRELHRAPRVYGGDLGGPSRISSDGKVLAQTMNQYRVDLVAMPGGRTLATLANPEFKSIQDTDFNDDGSKLAVVTSDNAFVWDLALVRSTLRDLGLDWDDDPDGGNRAQEPEPAAGVVQSDF